MVWDGEDVDAVVVVVADQQQQSIVFLRAEGEEPAKSRVSFATWFSRVLTDFHVQNELINT